ncbi:MAG: amino acid ABC transporter permease [Phycisphaerae bacterium]
MTCQRSSLLIACILASAAAAVEPRPLRVGAKNFTEQHILGELIAQLIERHTALPVERRFDLGGTGVCHAALSAGQLDIYVEYTGTALLEILKLPRLQDRDAVFRTVARAYRERFDAVWLPPLGFSNTYALTVRRSDAQARGWKRVSDLVEAASDLTAGLTSEFIERPDGYPGLRAAYGIRFGAIHDLDPGLMYAALAEGQVDLICAFSTDGRIIAYNLTPLSDNKNFFPPYDAAPIVAGNALRDFPEIADVLASLAGTIDTVQMQKLNFEVDERKRAPRDVAREWLDRRAGTPAGATEVLPAGDAEPAGFLRLAVHRRQELKIKTFEHLGLTGMATFLAILIGVPAGMFIHQHRRLAPAALAVTEIVQTVPSLAMLAFLFAVYGVLGAVPAITALVLYSLLPILLNTFTGLGNTPPEAREAAQGLGMSRFQQLRLVEFPLALPVIVAGIRTACVWTVGIATLSTYIGAGGLGDFISRGLARNDPALTLLGAVPAALIAVVLSLLIRALERRLKRW